MDTGTKHVVELLRSLADAIELGRAVYFEVKTEAGARHGIVREMAEFEQFEIRAEIDPNAPKRCPRCRGAMPEGKCVTVDCPVDAEDPGPFTWYSRDGRMWHAGCGGLLEPIDKGYGLIRCTKCGAADS